MEGVAEYYATREPRYCRMADLADAPKALQALIDLVVQRRSQLEHRSSFLELLELFSQVKEKLEALLEERSSAE